MIRGSALIGLGSPYGDDQLGWIAVDRLRPRLPEGVVAVKAAGGLDVLEFLTGQDEVVIMDSSTPAGRPGTIRWFAWPCGDLAERVSWSTHGPGLVEALRLAGTLGLLPRRVSIATVEAETQTREIAPDTPLGATAARGLEGLLESILDHFGTSTKVGGLAE
jgi:hydrogenase maturation protease